MNAVSEVSEVFVLEVEFANGRTKTMTFNSPEDRMGQLYCLAEARQEDCVWAQNGPDVRYFFVGADGEKTLALEKAVTGEVVSSLFELLPNPDGLNAVRAAEAAGALDSFAVLAGEGASEAPDELVIDLLTGFRHYCHRRGMDFDALVEQSADHFREETSSSPVPAPSLKG